jgi:hypothetical protein
MTADKRLQAARDRYHRAVREYLWELKEVLKPNTFVRWRSKPSDTIQQGQVVTSKRGSVLDDFRVFVMNEDTHRTYWISVLQITWVEG